MGESAKILSPDKNVLMPAMDADCPMAHMATEEGIRKVREEYDDVAVVCYINSTAALKELSDVCVTSDVISLFQNCLRTFRMCQNQCIRVRFFCCFYFFRIHKFMDNTETFVINKVLLRNLFCNKMCKISVRDKKDVFVRKRFYDLYCICGSNTYIRKLLQCCCGIMCKMF